MMVLNKGNVLFFIVLLLVFTGTFVFEANIVIAQGNSPKGINIDFGSDYSTLSPKTGAAAIGQAGDFWNSVSQAGNSDYTRNNLRYIDGFVGGVSIRIKNLPYYYGWNSGINDSMYDTYTFSSSGNGEITMINLTAGTYNIYLYGHGNSAEQNTLFSVSSGMTSYADKPTSKDARALTSKVWEEGLQYVVFRNVSINAGDNLTVNVAADQYRIINGMQLVPISLLNNSSENNGFNYSNGTMTNNIGNSTSNASNTKNKSAGFIGECFDTDGGFISNQSGSSLIRKSGSTIEQKNDFCSGNVLVEYGCLNGRIINASIACDGDCLSGLCIGGGTINGLNEGGNGCLVENRTVPFGYRVGSQFCDLDGDMKLQKRVRYYDQIIKCENNFECESNLCSDRQCIPITTFINDTKKFRVFTIKGVCRLTNPVSEEAYLDCLDEYLTTPLIADMERNNKFCFLRASVEEKLNETSGKIYFELINASSMYGDYENLVNKYTGGFTSYLAESFDYVEKPLNKAALFSSRFMFTDDYSGRTGEELDGGVIELKEGVASLVLPNNPQVRRIKLFDIEGEEMGNLRVSKEQSNCIRRCGVENETINLEQGEDCCPGFKPILKKGAFSDEWGCEK